MIDEGVDVIPPEHLLQWHLNLAPGGQRGQHRVCLSLGVRSEADVDVVPLVKVTTYGFGGVRAHQEMTA